ncbi:MAG: IPT/TIG domain-containing protein [Thermoflexales bacterium]|nr:IPT/TIG domain-containing protein [Thermoflexales bacterium]
MRKHLPISIALLLGLLAALMTVSAVAARPSLQLAITGVEPRTMLSTTGGTLSIYGSGFTTATMARLVGYGLLDTAFVNPNALRAVVPPGVPPGVYAVEVSEPSYSATLPAALTIVAPTVAPTPTSPPPPPPPGRPILTVRNFSVQPARVYPGAEFVVTVEIYNNGSRGAENTLVTFPGGTFVPVGQAGHLVGFMHINATVVITQTMRAPANLSSGTYNLQVNLSANDFEGNHYEYPQTISVEVVGGGAGRPQLVVESARTEPEVLGPGDRFTLTLQIANRGERTATRVVVGPASAELVVPAEGSSMASADRIAPGRAVTLTLPLVLGTVKQGGRVGLDLALSYGDSSGGTYSDRQSIGLEVSSSLADRPQLLIAAVQTEPPVVAPGDFFTLTLAVQNVGGGDAYRLLLTLGGEGGKELGPFVPRESGNVLFVSRVPAGETVRLTVPLVVDGSADAKAYGVPALLAYEDARGTSRSDVQRISLVVQRRPIFRIGFYRPVEGAMVGTPFPLPVELINLGKASVNVTMMEVTGEGLEIQNGSLYVGPLDGGTSASLEATAVAQQAGTAEVVVSVHYLDDFNRPQTVTQTLTVEVAGPPEPAPQESAPSSETPTFWEKILRFLRGLLGLGS